MTQFTFPDLPAAYLFAGAVIGLLLYFARRNQQQGWRKQRVSWYSSRANASVDAFKSRGEPEVEHEQLHHLGDLARLRQSLVAHGKSTRPETATQPALRDFAGKR
jgi:hypothetical protein